jgi:hypothetical protein
VVPIYRTISLVSLYIILFSIVGYGVLVGLYIGSANWAAPFAINSSDTSVLAILSQITASQASLATLHIDYNQTKENIVFNKVQIAALQKLERSFDTTKGKQKIIWAQSASDLLKYDDEIRKNIVVLQSDVAKNDEFRDIINKDLTLGLITKTDAATAISTIDNLANTTTTTKIAETNLVDSVRQHEMVDMGNIVMESQRVQIIFQIEQLESAINVDEDHMATDANLEKTIKTAIATAKLSPYYAAIESPSTIQLAVVPYNGNNQFSKNEPVYDCVFGLVVCRKVGTVVNVFPNEQIFENPLTKTNLRGYLIQLSVIPSAMRSKSLVIGHKPLFF